MIKPKTNILTAVAASIAMISGAGLSMVATATAAVAQTAGETVLAGGQWTKKSFKASGAWSIVERGGTRYLVLSEDFRTRNGPDLKIFLTPNPVSNLTGGNATDGSVLISVLESNRGAQEYEIPADIDLSAFASVVIHCEAYSKLWSAAALA